jgi:cyclopropane-fatty-acyl-phospholipid synthase
MILNRDFIRDVRSPISLLTSRLAGMVRPPNGLSASLTNVAAHYDISNDVFAAFLSKDMTYSCPIWLSIDNENKNDDTLEKAQLRKIHEAIRQARIKQDDHVLEIGTGWGSFAIEAVKTTGCRVTSLTLSAEQKIEAERPISAAGLAENIDILLEDYRAIVGHGRTFDNIVSIEMLEHVGKDHLVEYFRIVHRVLKRKGGIAVFQTSTLPESVSSWSLIPKMLILTG